MADQTIFNNEQETANGSIVDEKDEDKRCKNLPEAALNIPQILETFDIVEKVGFGTFSTVYLARLKERADKTFAIKFIIPTTHPSRTAMELSCLISLGGRSHILQAYSCVRHFDDVAIVMPYFPHDEFKSYVDDLNPDELKSYAFGLLSALSVVHEADIIHRDIKPRNFLFNRKNKKFALIDFGLAQKVSIATIPRQRDRQKSVVLDTRGSNLGRGFKGHAGNNENITPKVRKNSQRSADENVCGCFGRPVVCRKCLKKPVQSACRAGTPGFRPPEVLMKYAHQTTAVDIWAAGVIFISLISGKYPFFENVDDMTSLRLITRLLGAKVMKESAAAIGKHFICTPEYPARDLVSLCQNFRNRSKIVTPSTVKVRPKEGHDNDEGNNNNNNNTNDDTEIMDVNDNNNQIIHDDERTEPIGADDEGRDPAAAAGSGIRGDLDVSGSPGVADNVGSRSFIDLLPRSTFDLLRRMLDPNPLTRISAADALKHEYFGD